MLRPVSELPRKVNPRTTRESYVSHDVREFMRGSYDICLVEYEGRKAKNVATSLRKYVRDRHVDGVSVVMRGGRPYLVREVTR